MDECEVAMISIAEFIINIAISNPRINDLLLYELTERINFELDHDIRTCMLDIVRVLTEEKPHLMH